METMYNSLATTEREELLLQILHGRLATASAHKLAKRQYSRLPVTVRMLLERDAKARN